MELIAQEYFKIIDIIGQYDGLMMTIKGWLITVGMALIGYAFQQRQRSILLLVLVSAVCFSLVDAKFKEYQTSYYPRMRTIEKCISTKNELAACLPLQVDASWSESKVWYGVFLQYGKFGVIMPHFIVFLLALFLYVKPDILFTNSQLTNQSSRSPAASAD